jgi:hypothetical protein
MMSDIPPVVIERFWSKVAITANPDKCSEYVFSCLMNGLPIDTYEQFKRVTLRHIGILKSQDQQKE